MKTSLGHLPERKQREFVRIAGIIQKKFADLVARSASDARRDGRIFKIILLVLGENLTCASDGGVMNHRAQPPLTIAMPISS